MPTLMAGMRERLARLLEAEQGRLALWLPVAMGCGVLAFLLPRADPPGWLAWVGLLPMIPAAWLARRHLLAGWLAGLLAAFGLGFALAAWHVARAAPLPELPRGAVVVTGTVIELDPLPQGARITLAGARWAEGGEPMARTLRIRLQPRDLARPEPGDVIAVRALVRAPSPPAYPGAWDFQRAAFFEGQGGAGFALAPLEVLRRGGAAPPLAGLRAAIETRVMAALPGAAGAIAAALLTGGQSGIPPAELQAMRDSGLAHLLSVSGLHIAIVLGLAFWLVRAGLALWPGFALRYGTRPWAALAGLAAGGAYMVLTGSQVPMQRSFVMAALVTLALLAGRRAISPRLLGFAAVAVMAVQPAAILGPSFQMSFAAVLALIAGFEAARPWLSAGTAPRPWWQRGLLIVAASLLTSVLAGAATTPFGLHHFGRLQLYGVAANAVAVPLTSLLVMPAGLLALFMMPLGLEAWPLWLMGWGVEGVLAVARAVASWPASSVAAVPIPGWGLALVALGLCWLCLWRARWRWLGVPAMAAGLTTGLLVTPPDAVVASDGRLFALRSGEQLLLERRAGASRFTRDIWLRSFGEAAAPDLPREGDAGRIACTPNACTLHDAAGAPAILLLRPPASPPRRGPRPPEPPAAGVCGTAPVILSPEPVRGRCEASQVVDRFAVWRDGAHAVWLTPDGPRVLSDRAHRGDRPWVPPRPRPRAQQSEDAMAETE